MRPGITRAGGIELLYPRKVPFFHSPVSSIFGVSSPISLPVIPDFLRASTTGQTVYINSKGACEQMLKPFTAGVLICDVPLYKEPEKTVYTKTGDLFGILCVILFIAFFIFKYIKKIKGKLVV